MATFFRWLASVMVLASVASVVGSAIAEAERHATAEKGAKRFALVYLHDDESTKSFASLLEAHGHTVDKVQLDTVPRTDFGADSAVIVTSDIEQAWSSAAAEKIKDTQKPVLGL